MNIYIYIHNVLYIYLIYILFIYLFIFTYLYIHICNGHFPWPCWITKGYIPLNLYHIPYDGWDIPVVWLQPCHFRLTRVRMAFSHGIAQEVPGKHFSDRNMCCIFPQICILLAQSWVIGPNNQPSINHCLTYIFHLKVHNPPPLK